MSYFSPHTDSARERALDLPVALSGEKAARLFFESCFAQTDPAVETLFVAHLDDQVRCIHLTQHQGDSSSANFPLRKVLLDAAKHDSRGVILAHNHPSGDPCPSSTDHATTRRFATACEAIDLTLVDHLVTGGGEWSSFRRMGLL